MGRFYYVFLLLIAFFLMVIYDLYDSFLLSVMLLLSPFCLYFFSKIFCKLVFLIIKFTRTKSLIMQILKAFIYIAQVILDNPNRYLILSHHSGTHKQQ